MSVFCIPHTSGMRITQAVCCLTPGVYCVCAGGGFLRISRAPVTASSVPSDAHWLSRTRWRVMTSHIQYFQPAVILQCWTSVAWSTTAGRLRETEFHSACFRAGFKQWSAPAPQGTKAHIKNIPILYNTRLYWRNCIYIIAFKAVRIY